MSAEGPQELTRKQIPAIFRQSGSVVEHAILAYLTDSRRSLSTRRNLLSVLKRFAGWCEANGVPFLQATPQSLTRFISSLSVSPSTKHSYLSALRGMFDQLVAEGLVPSNPTDPLTVDPDEIDDRSTPEIDEEQFRALLASIKPTSAINCRDRALLHVLWETGARLIEIARLTLGAFRQTEEQDLLRLVNQFGHERFTPISEATAHAITDYVSMANLTEESPGTPLFRPTIKSTRRLAEHASSVQYLGRTISRRIVDAGLPETLSADSFRVTVLRNLFRQGKTIEEAQAFIGHESREATVRQMRRFQRAASDAAR